MTEIRFLTTFYLAFSLRSITYYGILDRCNILICPRFPVYLRPYTNGILSCVSPWLRSTSFCAVDHLVCTALPRGHTTIRQVFTFAHVLWWNIVQVRILHRRQAYLASYQANISPLNFYDEEFKGRYMGISCMIYIITDRFFIYNKKNLGIIWELNSVSESVFSQCE